MPVADADSVGPADSLEPAELTEPAVSAGCADSGEYAGRAGVALASVCNARVVLCPMLSPRRRPRLLMTVRACSAHYTPLPGGRDGRFDLLFVHDDAGVVFVAPEPSS
jgi:hypothetical protein